MKYLTFLTVWLLVLAQIPLFAQNTSPWIRVSCNDETPFKDKIISPSKSYISIRVEKACVSPQANWWTSLVSRNRQAFITAEVDAIYPSSPAFSDRRSSPGTELPRKKQVTEIGWQRTVVQALPTSFLSLNIRLKLNTTARDGLEDIIGVAADVSNKTPQLTVAQSALGVASGVKTLLDQIFNRSLAVTQLSSDFDMVANSSLTKRPGYYVVFGGDGVPYSRYSNGAAKLKWDGVTLTFDGAPVTDITYFVVLLETQSQFFAAKDFDMLASVRDPWARFYIESKNVIDKITDKPSYETTLSLIRSNLISARGFLDANDNYLPSERDGMHMALKGIIQNSLKERVAVLRLAVNSQVAEQLLSSDATTGTLQPTSPITKSPL